jgi:hypothetical protein
MKIIHAITCDDPWGEPWPPASTDIWHVLRRANGFTAWRAIRIAPSDPPPSDAHDHLGGNRNSN